MSFNDEAGMSILFPLYDTTSSPLETSLTDMPSSAFSRASSESILRKADSTIYAVLWENNNTGIKQRINNMLLFIFISDVEQGITLINYAGVIMTYNVT